ncbi:hypothetical protein TNCV_1121761 [Trichonephila clavipes]|nr:hypothetical protein TNCV_1121761 [Trichonephila clavipes]
MTSLNEHTRRVSRTMHLKELTSDRDMMQGYWLRRTSDFFLAETCIDEESSDVSKSILLIAERQRKSNSFLM